jgi:hypothetical protein
MYLDLKLRDDEASDLRELLTQTAAPGSLQTRLISRIDAAIEAEKRPRRRLRAHTSPRRPHERTLP